MTDTADQDGVLIGLSAVVMALHQGRLAVLTTHDADGADALPFGPFDPQRDRTFELALRAFVTAQTGFRLGFVEQLYTFGDAGRDLPHATGDGSRRRVVSVGYLALTPEAAAPGAADARWTPVEAMFPWEDARSSAATPIRPDLVAALCAWAGGDERRRSRIDSLFASPEGRWNEERVLDRYELLYEAGLVSEAARDQGLVAPAPDSGQPMTSDHRRILATALGRLRAKLKYRPVLFDLMPETFTLSELQSAAEAIAGLSLHKQNFRRGVERTGLVAPTGRLSSGTGGRPAELFRFSGADPLNGHASGIALPAQR